MEIIHERRPNLPTQTKKQKNLKRKSRLVIKGKNDLATINPTLAAQADKSWDPREVTVGSSKRVGWVCPTNKEHKWKAPISQRSAGTGCPVCANRVIIKGINDLTTTHPLLAAACDGSWDPSKFLSGSHTKVRWVCSLDKRHIYTCSINERARGVGCSLCNGKIVAPGINDLATLDPVLASECDNSWDPTKVRQFCNTKVGWICSKDTSHTWQATIANRSNGGGCPGCAVSGYDVTAPGWLYLITDVDRDLLQIGISNYPKQRLRHHERSGWTVLDIIGPFEGDLCYAWEKSIISFIRELGAKEPTNMGRFEGFTESWSIAEYKINTISELRERVLNREIPKI
jgi:hypothetical protein